MAKASDIAPVSRRMPTRMPASGRPMRSAAVSATVLIEFAVTRSRCSTTAGMTAVLAGRNSSVTVAIRKAMTYTSRMSISTTNGTATSSAARTRSQANIVHRRFQRSTSVPASGPRMTFGTAVAANVSPTSSAPPPVASYTRKPSATVWMRSPKRLIELAEPQEREIAVADEAQVRRLAAHAGRLGPGLADVGRERARPPSTGRQARPPRPSPGAPARCRRAPASIGPAHRRESSSRRLPRRCRVPGGHRRC